MKKIIILGIVIPLLLVLINGCGVANYTYSNNDPESVFPELAFYGQWINIKPWGEVWEPDATYDWGPFVNGQWQFTDRGWMWDSQEPYAWIVYHYGEWAYSDADGWIWVPGYEWYPSRVRCRKAIILHGLQFRLKVGIFLMIIIILEARFGLLSAEVILTIRMLVVIVFILIHSIT